MDKQNIPIEDGFLATQIDYNDFSGMNWIWKGFGSVISQPTNRHYWRLLVFQNGGMAAPQAHTKGQKFKEYSSQKHRNVPFFL